VNNLDWNNQLTHLALIQAFEICSELSWKVLKDYLYENGIDVSLPKKVIKEAFNKKVIKNGQIWINMIEARNATSHEYNMEKVKLLLQNISTVFYEELNTFHICINSDEI
jgi:nucleotidyltransferase substrate binding protein (TIGR01987 family)